MLDLSLTKKQVAFQKQLQRFVDTEILPVARENDLKHHVDRNIIARMGKLGLLGVTIPRKYGGSGLDFVSLAIVAEEIERGDAAFRTLLSVHLGLNSMALLKFGSEQQKAKFLVPQAQGMTRFRSMATKDTRTMNQLSADISEMHEPRSSTKARLKFIK